MLILTSAALRGPPRPGLAAGWPGPVAMVLRPGHGLGRAARRALEAEAVVIECLSPPGSGGALLSGIARGLPWLWRGEGEPLLFADAPLPEGELARMRARGLAAPRRAEAGWSASGSGRLVRLTLGRDLAAHPLLADGLALIGARRVPDAALVALLAATLGGELDA